MNVIDRFLRYVSFHTTSDPLSEGVPSTPRQLLLAQALKDELLEMGIEDAFLDEFGRVYGHVPATPGREDVPVLGLIAHMDTSPDAPGENVKPQFVEYKGGDILLNAEKNIVMRAEDFPDLAPHVGQTLIVTDGTTLLGADDKAGVAEIMTIADYLLQHPEVPHGKIALAFTPDEEIGSGADHFDFARFGASYAYTLDGDAIGGIEYECFNAAGAVVTLHGRNIHPGSAKNIMKNAVLMAAHFISLLPAAQTPAHTEGYEGFYHVGSCTATEEDGCIRLIIRDHDRAAFEVRKDFLRRTVDYLNSIYGAGSLELEMHDSYYNMREKLTDHMFLIDRAEAAFRACGVTPRSIAIRGGTDGALLSWQGLPCPNLSTGCNQFHGVYEFASVQEMEQMISVLTWLVRCDG